ncbi:MAG TPA: hypothetical protein VE981_07635 [Planctomycetota bacterium]|nr:hypothetical protein [Planctomycetota bacterium]
MPSSVATLEVDLRRPSGHEMLEKLERTMGLRFNIRRARITPRRSRWLLEIEAPARKD